MNEKFMLTAWLAGKTLDSGITLAGLSLSSKLVETSLIGGPLVQSGNLSNYLIAKMALTGAYIGMYALSKASKNEKLNYVFTKTIPIVNGLVWGAVGINIIQIAPLLLNGVR